MAAKRTDDEAVSLTTIPPRSASHEKFERLIGSTRDIPPVRTAVAHPCDATSLEGALEAAADKIIEPILVGPEHRIRASPRRSARASTESRSSMPRTAMPPPPRPLSWCARARPSC